MREGLAGLYRGIVPALFGVSHGALQFTAYEKLKDMRATMYHKDDIENIGTLEYITMAALSKIFASVTCYPYQVVKSRMQVQSEYVSKSYRSVGSTISTIMR